MSYYIKLLIYIYSIYIYSKSCAPVLNLPIYITFSDIKIQIANPLPNVLYILYKCIIYNI